MNTPADLLEIIIKLIILFGVGITGILCFAGYIIKLVELTPKYAYNIEWIVKRSSSSKLETTFKKVLMLPVLSLVIIAWPITELILWILSD